MTVQQQEHFLLMKQQGGTCTTVQSISFKKIIAVGDCGSQKILLIPLTLDTNDWEQGGNTCWYIHDFCESRADCSVDVSLSPLTWTAL